MIPAFIAGLASFFMPCTFPLVPSYLAFVSGQFSQTEGEKLSRTRTSRNALFFILGFSVIFIFFGIIAGLIGNHLGQFRIILSKLAGLVIILFGLFMLDVLKFGKLRKNFNFPMPASIKPGNPISSLMLGSSMALGWSPCIGPILGSILLLASTSETVAGGFIMLVIFSIGLGLPFFLLAFLGISLFEKLLTKRKYIKYMNIIGGIMLIILGILQLTDRLGFIMGWLYKVNPQVLNNFL